MAVAISFNPQTATVRLVVLGNVQVDEVLHGIRSILGAPWFALVQGVLVDGREMRPWATLPDLWRILGFLKENHQLIQSIPVAFVVTHDLSYGMGRLFERYAEGWVGLAMRTFRDVNEAWRWLAKEGTGQNHLPLPERRQAIRHPCVLKTTWDDRAGPVVAEWSAWVLDISTTGMGIHQSAQLAVGTRLTLGIHGPSKSLSPVRARVVRCSQPFDHQLMGTVFDSPIAETDLHSLLS